MSLTMAKLVEMSYGQRIKFDCEAGFTLNGLCTEYNVSRFIMKQVLKTMKLTVKPGRAGPALEQWMRRHDHET